MAYVKCIRNLISSTVPDGKTVTPTDDISIWLACGGRSESYTTLSQVLADVACLNALINDNNAVDYLVRSITWASDVCGDSGAMTAIGGNNYAANTLLDDSTWCSAICNSTYFESVLNVKVPTMTSDTAPEGVASASTVTSPYLAYRAFDKSANEWRSAYGVSTAWIQYAFTEAIPLYKAVYTPHYSEGYRSHNFNLNASNDGVSFDTLGTYSKSTSSAESINITPTASYTTYRLDFTTANTYFSNTGYFTAVDELQFYGRADI